MNFRCHKYFSSSENVRLQRSCIQLFRIQVMWKCYNESDLLLNIYRYFICTFPHITLILKYIYEYLLKLFSILSIFVSISCLSSLQSLWFIVQNANVPFNTNVYNGLDTAVDTERIRTDIDYLHSRQKYFDQTTERTAVLTQFGVILSTQFCFYSQV